MKILVTGNAGFIGFIGFIGFDVAKRLLERAETVVGYAPSPPVDEGVARFIDWYKDFYHAD